MSRRNSRRRARFRPIAPSSRSERSAPDEDGAATSNAKRMLEGIRRLADLPRAILKKLEAHTEEDEPYIALWVSGWFWLAGIGLVVGCYRLDVLFVVFDNRQRGYLTSPDCAWNFSVIYPVLLFNGIRLYQKMCRFFDVAQGAGLLVEADDSPVDEVAAAAAKESWLKGFPAALVSIFFVLALLWTLGEWYKGSARPLFRNELTSEFIRLDDNGLPKQGLAPANGDDLWPYWGVGVFQSTKDPKGWSPAGSATRLANGLLSLTFFTLLACAFTSFVLLTALSITFFLAISTYLEKCDENRPGIRLILSGRDGRSLATVARPLMEHLFTFFLFLTLFMIAERLQAAYTVGPLDGSKSRSFVEFVNENANPFHSTFKPGSFWEVFRLDSNADHSGMVIWMLDVIFYIGLIAWPLASLRRSIPNSRGWLRVEGQSTVADDNATWRYYIWVASPASVLCVVFWRLALVAYCAVLADLGLRALKPILPNPRGIKHALEVAITKKPRPKDDAPPAPPSP